MLKPDKINAAIEFIVSKIGDKLQGNSLDNLKAWLKLLLENFPDNIGPKLSELINAGNVTPATIETVIVERLGLKVFNFNKPLEEVLAENVNRLAEQKLVREEQKSLETWLEHDTVREALPKLYIDWVKAASSADADDDPDTAVVELDLDLDEFLKLVAALFKIGEIDLSVPMSDTAAIDAYVDAQLKVAKETQEEEEAEAQTSAREKRKGINLLVIGLGLVSIVVCLGIAFYALGFGETMQGFGETLSNPAIAPELVNTSSGDTIEVYDAAVGNGLVPDPNSIHTRKDDGGGTGLYKEITLYAESQDPGAVLERNTYYTVARTNVPGVVVVEVREGIYRYAPESAFLNFGQVPNAISVTENPELAEKALATARAHSSLPKFSWGSSIGLLTIGYIALFLLSKLGEAQLEGVFGLSKFLFTMLGITGVLYLQAQHLDFLTQLISLGVILALTAASAIDPKLLKVTEIMAGASASDVPDLVWDILPRKDANLWEKMRKLIEFSDFDTVIVMILVFGINDPQWSPIFAMFGTQVGILISGLGQFGVAALEMKARAESSDDDSDRNLLLVALITAIISISTLAVGFGSKVLPSLADKFSYEISPIPDPIFSGLITLVGVVFGAMFVAKKTTYANDDRLYDFGAWTAAFNIVGLGLLYVLSAATPLAVTITIVLVLILVIFLAIRVYRSE